MTWADFARYPDPVGYGMFLLGLGLFLYGTTSLYRQYRKQARRAVWNLGWLAVGLWAVAYCGTRVLDRIF